MGQHLADIGGERGACVLHLGDYDPSGEHVFTALSENLNQFACAYGSWVDTHRIAVLPEQVEAYNLPTAPPKATDRRSFSGVATTQLEAFAPDQLIALVEDVIKSRMDADVYQQTMADEAEMITQLTRTVA
jgi:hypothetical protein